MLLSIISIRNHTVQWIVVIAPIFLLLGVLTVDNELYNGAQNGKMFWFYYAMAILTFVNTGMMIAKGSYLYPTKTDIYIILFSLYILIHAWAFNQIHSLAIHLFTLLLIGYLQLRILFSQSNLSKEILIATLLIAGIIESVWGYMQLNDLIASQHNLFKTTGSFFNPGPYSGFLALVLPLAVSIALKTTTAKPKDRFDYHFRRINKTLSYLCISTILITLPATMSRAAWIAALAGSGVVLVQHYGLTTWMKKYQKKACISALLLLILGVSLGYSLFRMKEKSAEGRLLIWKISTSMIADHPFFGTGIGSFAGKYGEAQYKYFEAGKGSIREELVAGTPTYAFNDFFQLTCELGFAGLVLALLAIFSIFRQAHHPGLSGSLTTLLLFSLFSYPFNLLPFCIVFIMLAGLLVENRPTNQERKYSIPTALLFATIVGLILWKRIPEHTNYKDWNELEIYSQIGNSDVNNEYKKLYNTLYDNENYLFQYGKSLSIEKRYNESNHILREGLKHSSDPMFLNIMGENYRKLKEFDRAKQCFQRSMLQLPNRHYPIYLMAKLCKETGETDEAKRYARQAIAKNPKVETTAIREIKTEMQQIIRNE